MLHPLCLLTAAQCPSMPHSAAWPAADAEGGGGQGTVATQSTHAHARPSLAALCPLSGGDPGVSNHLASADFGRLSVSSSSHVYG